MKKSKLLSWRPHDPAEWNRETAECTLAGRGALVSLADALWMSPHGTCAVPNDAGTIALWCRARREWASVEPDVMLVLAPHPTVPGCLTWPWLLALYKVQNAAYETKQRVGRNGGKAKAAKYRDASSATNTGSTATDNPSSATRDGAVSLRSRATDSASTASKIVATSSTALQDRDRDLRTTREAETCALPKSTQVSAISVYNSNGSTAPHGESASSPACAPLQGAPPPPLGESTNGEPQQQPRGPALHTEPASSDDDDWEQFAPRVPQRAHAPMAPIGAILGTILPQSSPDNAA